MRVLLINRNDFIDGGADRVFLNTFDLLQNSKFASERPLSRERSVSGVSAGGEGGGEVEVHVEKFTRKDAGLENTPDPRSLSWWGKMRTVKDYQYNKQVGKCLEKKIREFKPDVAHVHLIFGTLSVSVLRVLKRYGVPVVMTLHDYRLICPANAMLNRHGKVCELCRGKRYYNCLTHRCSEGNLFFSGVIMLEAYMRRYLLRPLKLVDHFIFVSQFAQNKHLEFEPRYALKSSLLYNMNVPVHETPIMKGDYYLYYGRLSREKGILTLITAAQKANVKLIIAGTGPQEPELLAYLQNQQPPTSNQQPATSNQQPATSNISLVGFQTGSALQTLIVNSSFVVLPSEWYENNPMSVVEAFSLGKPVIGSRIGGIPELVSAGNGYLFDHGNPESLADVLTRAEKISPDEYERMSIACREFAAKNFDRELHFRHLADSYQQVMNY